MENQTIYTVIGNKSVKTEVKLSDKLRSVSKWLRSKKSISEEQGNLRIDLETAEKEGDKKKVAKIQKRLGILAYVMDKKIKVDEKLNRDIVQPEMFARNLTEEQFTKNIVKENEAKEAAEKAKAQKAAEEAAKAKEEAEAKKKREEEEQRKADEAKKAVNDPAKREVIGNLPDPAAPVQEKAEVQAEVQKPTTKQEENKGVLQFKPIKRAEKRETPKATTITGVKTLEAPKTTVLPEVALEKQEKEEEMGNEVTSHVVTRPQSIRPGFAEESQVIVKSDEELVADYEAGIKEVEEEQKMEEQAARDRDKERVHASGVMLAKDLSGIRKKAASRKDNLKKTIEAGRKAIAAAKKALNNGSDLAEQETTKAANVVTEQEAAHAKEIAAATQTMEEQDIKLKAAKKIQEINDSYISVVAECMAIIRDEANKTGKERAEAADRILAADEERSAKIAEVNAKKEEKLNASIEANKSENEKKAETKEKSSEPEKENESQEKEAPKQEMQKTESNPDKVITAGVLVTPKTEEGAEIGGPQREGETNEEYMERIVREEEAKKAAEDAQKEQEPVGKHFASSKPTEIKEEAPKTLFAEVDTPEVPYKKVNTQKQEPSIEMTNEIKYSPEIKEEKLAIAGEEKPIEVKPLIVPESTKEVKPSEDKTKEDFITSQVDRVEALTKDIKEAKEALKSKDKSIVALATADLDKIQNEINGVLHPKSLTENPDGLKSSAELAMEKANKKFSEEILQGLKERNIDADLLDELSNDEAEVEKGRTK